MFFFNIDPFRRKRRHTIKRLNDLYVLLTNRLVGSVSTPDGRLARRHPCVRNKYHQSNHSSSCKISIITKYALYGKSEMEAKN